MSLLPHVFATLPAGNVPASYLDDNFNALLSSQFVSAFSQMTPAQIADVQAGTQTQDVTAALQAVYNSFGTMGGVVYYPPGIYKVSTTITIPQAVVSIGPGNGWAAVAPTFGATIRTSSATNDVFQVTTASGCVFRDISFGSIPTRTAGFYVNILSDGVNVNLRSRFENCYFQGASSCIGLAFAARFWVVRDCVFDQFSNYGIYYPSTGATDAGDNYVTGCVFIGTSAAQASIYSEASAAIWVVGNKFFSGKYGMWHNARGTTGTFQIVANSFEDQVNAQIVISQAVPGIIAGQLSINDNEFLISGAAPLNPPIWVQAGAAQYLFRVNISDNTFNMNYSLNASVISLQDGQNVMVSGNTIDLGGFATTNGITTGGNATGAQILYNTFANCTTAQHYGNGLNASTIVKEASGVAFADLGSWANGSELYCNNGTFGSNPLTGAGTGAFARRINGAWVGT